MILKRMTILTSQKNKDMAEESISISRDASVSLAKQQDFIGVNKADWNRLKRKIGKCRNHTNWWLNIAFTSFGIMGSSFLSFLTLPLDSTSTWAIPTIISISIFMLIIGLICVVAHKQQNKNENAKLDDVKEIIEEIDNSFINHQ